MYDLRRYSQMLLRTNSFETCTSCQQR